MDDTTADVSPKATTRFTCAAPASPARVRALAEMVEETLTALLGRRPADHEFTLVVSNLNLKAELRAFTDESASAGRAIESVSRDPRVLRHVQAERRAKVAHALRVGYEKLREAEIEVSGTRGEPPVLVDKMLISVLKSLEEDDDEPTTIQGSSEEVSSIGGISRRQDGHLAAKVRVEGRWGDFQIATEAIPAAFELLRTGGLARFDLDATWESTGNTYRIVPSRTKVLDIVPLEPLLSSEELLAALRDAVSTDTANACARYVYDEAGIDLPEGA